MFTMTIELCSNHNGLGQGHYRFEVLERNVKETLQEPFQELQV